MDDVVELHVVADDVELIKHQLAAFCEVQQLKVIRLFDRNLEQEERVELGWAE